MISPLISRTMNAAGSRARCARCWRSVVGGAAVRSVVQRVPQETRAPGAPVGATTVGKGGAAGANPVGNAGAAGTNPVGNAGAAGANPVGNAARAGANPVGAAGAAGSTPATGGTPGPAGALVSVEDRPMRSAPQRSRGRAPSRCTASPAWTCRWRPRSARPQHPRTRADARFLRCLRTVTGSITIRGTSHVASLDGLERLESIGGELILERNEILSSVAGLRGLLRQLRGPLRPRWHLCATASKPRRAREPDDRGWAVRSRTIPCWIASRRCPT